MNLKDDRLNKYLDTFEVREPNLIAKNKRSWMFKVEHYDGTPRALKIYIPGEGRIESSNWLKAHEGHGAAKLYDHRQDAQLIEWLDGPGLDQLSQSGHDFEAMTRLVVTASRLHQRAPASLPHAMDLDDIFDDLFALSYGPDCPAQLRKDMGRATDFARQILNTPQEKRILHGDFHFANVILTKLGSKAIDPQGVLGDPCYELAIAFRNPYKARNIVRNPDRALAMARLAHKYLGVDPARQLAWAAAVCARTIARRAGKQLTGENAAHKNLPMLVELADSRFS